MNKINKTNKSYKKVIIITIIIGIIFIVSNIIYNKTTKYEEWVVCNYKGELTNYQETIKFRYMFERMYGYYEYRTIIINDEEVFKTTKQKVEDFGKDFVLSDNLSYKVEENGNQLKTSFYIKAIDYSDFINKYFEEDDINIDSTIEDIVNKFGENYECEIK